MIAKLEPLVERMKHERALLLDCAQQFTDAGAQRRRPGENYSAREILAHLAGAERGMIRMAQLGAAGQNPRLPPGYVNDEYNARQQNKRKDKTVAELVAELNDSRAQLLTFLESVKEEDLPKSAEHPILGDTDVWSVLNVLVTHEEEHTQQLGAWLTQLKTEHAK